MQTQKEILYDLRYQSGKTLLECKRVYDKVKQNKNKALKILLSK